MNVDPELARAAPGRPRRRPWPVVGAVALTLLAAASLSLGLGCRSLDKAELEARLLALGKNAPVSHVERLALPSAVDDASEPLELVYLRAPALHPAPPYDRPPVVLVHGTPSTLFSWTELIFGPDGSGGLNGTRDVVAIEVIGHGIARDDGMRVDFARCARFVVDAIRALGLERVHLVGSSYGGEFAWRAALDAPELVASLVLIDSSGYARREGDWLPEEIAMRENPLAKIGWVLNSRERITRALAPHFDVIPPDRVEEFYLVCSNASNWRAMVDLARDENGDREAEIRGIEAPTLVLWGAEDVAYRLDVYGERFAREIPRSHFVVLDETGHYPHEQRPAEVAAALDRFFASVEDRP